MGRRVLVASCLVVAIVLIGILGQRILFPDRSGLVTGKPDGTPERPLSEDPLRIVVRTALGHVEGRVIGSPWRVLQEGATLNPHDEVRTGPDSYARIQLGPSVTIELADRTEVNVAQLSRTLSRVRLQDGRVVSEVHGAQGFRFRVQVQGSSAEAETLKGRFAVLRRGESPVTVAAETGSVEVRAQGMRVQVGPGEQTAVLPNSPPTPATKIPVSLLLKLGEPPPSKMRAKQARITGQTSPGAVLSINQQPAPVGADGAFAAAVALKEGDNEIVVEVEDVIGRRQQSKLPRITVDAEPPQVAGKVVW